MLLHCLSQLEDWFQNSKANLVIRCITYGVIDFSLTSWSVVPRLHRLFQKLSTQFRKTFTVASYCLQRIALSVRSARSDRKTWF